MNHLIIYHSEDNDGVCSCALIEDWLKKTTILDEYGQSNVYRLPSNYASLAKLVEENDFDDYFGKYDYVWMTDVSFNDWHYMKRLYDMFGERFIWMDHHAPIIRDSEEHGFSKANGFRDTGRSAILCVYHYLYDQRDADYNTGEIPSILRLLSSWDCWAWTKEGLNEKFIRSFNTGVSVFSELSVDWYLDRMDTLLLPGSHEENYRYPLDSNDSVRSSIAEYVNLGGQIIDRQDKANEALVLGYGEEGWSVDGEKNAIMIVTSGPTNSQMFKSVADKFEHGVVFKHSKEGKWLVSLYNTRNDITFDCGAYLKKKYNGGGHIGAAGCTLNDTEFFKVLWEKNL